MRRTAFIAGAVLILGLAGLLQVAAARQGGEESTHEWVVVCHRTGSATNPFVLIVVAEEATTGADIGPQHGGHNGGHTGDVFLDLVFGPAEHHAALEFAQENRHNAEEVCVQEQGPGPGPGPGVPTAPPAPGQQGAAPVTG